MEKRNNKNNKNKKYGFTLLELLAVVVLISVVFSIATGIYSSAINSSKEKSTILAINNVRKAAELYSKENSDDLKWNYITDSNGKKKGYYMCLSVQQLINSGFFDDKFFKRDIYENKINANSFVEIRKNLLYGDYNVKINTKATTLLECELSMSSFDVDGYEAYTDTFSFDADFSDAEVGEDRFKVYYYNHGSENKLGDGDCKNNKCVVTHLKDNHPYVVQLCLNRSINSDNFCEFFNWDTSTFKKTNIMFSPNEVYYYYRNVSIDYNDAEQKIYTTSSFPSPVRYFKSDVDGIIDSNQVIYKCENNDYNRCNSRASSIEGEVLYRVDNNFYNTNKKINFSIRKDVDIYSSYIYTYILDASSNIGVHKVSIPPIKTEFKINYINECSNLEGTIDSHTCKYASNCTLSDNTTRCFGYNFNGWKLNNTGSLIANRTSFVQKDMVSDDELNYYGVWTPISYNIRYTTNGGKWSGNNHPSSATYGNQFVVDHLTKSISFKGYENNTPDANGTNVTITDNDGSPVDQTFRGWDISNTENITNVSNVMDTKFMNLRGTSGDVTFTARWGNVTGVLPKVTKTGFTCGWSTSSSGTKIEFNSGATYSKTNESLADGSTIKLYAVCTVIKPKEYKLDLNGFLDGTNSGNIANYGTVDVYINETRVADDVTDYYTSHVEGTTYEIKDIKARTGHNKGRVIEGSVSGTINANTNVRLEFNTNVCTINYNANGGSFTKNDKPLQDNIRYDSYLGNDADGIRNPVASYGATRNNHVPYPGKEWTNGSSYFDQTKKYKAQNICSDLGSGNRSVTLKVNWYERCTSKENKSNVRTYHWSYVKKECSSKSRNANGQSNLRRYYDFKFYDCTCKVDKIVSSNKVCDASPSSNLAVSSHKSGNSNWNQRAVIQYNVSDNGKKACNGKYHVNYYVDRVCTDGGVNTKSGGEELFFHGYFFYDYGSGAYNSFSPSDYWTHDVKSKVNDRISSKKSATDACLHACKLKYN